MSDQPLHEQHCTAIAKGEPPLAPDEVRALLAALDPPWELVADGQAIQRRFEFRNYYRTLAFVNAVAWIAHRADHHPDMEFGYNRCLVRYSTHAVGGLSRNDFICAARVNRLLDGETPH